MECPRDQKIPSSLDLKTTALSGRGAVSGSQVIELSWQNITCAFLGDWNAFSIPLLLQKGTFLLTGLYLETF